MITTSITILCLLLVTQSSTVPQSTNHGNQLTKARMLLSAELDVNIIGRSYPITISAAATVAQLKEEAQIDPNLVLTLAGQPLDDKMLLSDAGVCNEVTLDTLTPTIAAFDPDTKGEEWTINNDGTNTKAFVTSTTERNNRNGMTIYSNIIIDPNSEDIYSWNIKLIPGNARYQFLIGIASAVNGGVDLGFFGSDYSFNDGEVASLFLNMKERKLWLTKSGETWSKADVRIQDPIFVFQLNYCISDNGEDCHFECVNDEQHHPTVHSSTESPVSGDDDDVSGDDDDVSGDDVIDSPVQIRRQVWFFQEPVAVVLFVVALVLVGILGFVLHFLVRK